MKHSGQYTGQWREGVRQGYGSQFFELFNLTYTGQWKVPPLDKP